MMIKILRTILIWLIIGVSIFVPTAYFIVRISDSDFRDNAIGNLFATMIGLLVGIPVALEINRWQQKHQADAERRERLQADKERLEILLNRVKRELLDDYERVQELQKVLKQAGSARKDTWEWAITIVESFSFHANGELTSSGLQKLLSLETENSLYISYKDLYDLLHRVKQAVAAHTFFYGYTGNKEKANQQLKDIQDFTQKVFERLDHTISLLKSRL